MLDEFAAFVIAAPDPRTALNLFQKIRWAHPEPHCGDWDMDEDYAKTERQEENRHSPVTYGTWGIAKIGTAIFVLTEPCVLCVSFHAA